MEPLESRKPSQSEIDAEVTRMGLDKIAGKNEKRRGGILIAWAFFVVFLVLGIILNNILAVFIPLEIVSFYMVPFVFFLYALIPILIAYTIIVIILRIINGKVKN